jgi:hypothetical protein
MADVVVIEFSSPDAVSIYHSVNKIIGWEGAPDSEAWPDGMISHIAAEAGDKLIVVEAWESRADQERFMSSMLGPAFHQANVPEPIRVEWFSGVMNVRS